MSDYGRRLVVDEDFDRALVDTIEAMRREGLDVVTQFDVGQHIQRLVHHECRRYVLLQVASPDLMLRAIQTDVESGPCVPVTVAVYELPDGETIVEVTEPFAPVASDPAWRRAWPKLAAVADSEGAQVARALARIAPRATGHPDAATVSENEPSRRRGLA